MTNGIFLLLGSNLDNRLANLAAARSQLAIAGLGIKTMSAIYETLPWGKQDQPSFLNQVLAVETDLSPEALLTLALAVEDKIGRVRKERWGARIIDIDLLLYHSMVIHSPQLTVPHPRMTQRRFTLEPLCEIAPDFIHPETHATIQNLLDVCPDPLEVHRLKES